MGEERSGSDRRDPAAFAPEFRERLDAAARRAFGAPIEEIVPPGDVRDLLYEVLTNALNRKPRPISPEMMELVESSRAAGLVVTPGAGPSYLREPLRIEGAEGRSLLTDAILEERYGSGR
ncbi:MAG TPA: hypothetical protein VFJ16_15880 [Longimicrobium sp.]|nr:hypothetical protein [Longimicrobium sp.]